MSVRLASVAAVIGILAACSSADDPGAASPPPAPPSADGGKTSTADAAAPVTPDQVCTTLPRTFTKPATQFFKVLPSDQAAFDLFKTGRRKYLAPGTEFQTRADAASAKIFDAFKKIYPVAVEGMTTPPRSLIVDDPSFNAFAGAVRQSDGTTFGYWVVHYHSGMFRPGITDQQIELIAAHEFAHLVLRNVLDEEFKDIYYRESADEQGKIFGGYQPNEPDVQKLAETIAKLGGRTGQLFNTELNGFPTNVGASNDGDSEEVALYKRYIDFLLTTYGSASTPACTQQATTRREIAAILNARMNFATYELALGPDATQLDTLTKRYQTEVATCIGNRTFSFVALAEAVRKDEDPDAAAELAKVQNDLNAKLKYLGVIKGEYDVDVASPGSNIALKVFTISSRLQDIVRTELEKTEAQNGAFRVFTSEDDADEVAVRVAKVLGYDAKNLAGALLAQKTVEYRTVCEGQLAKNEVPAYGGFVSSHHSNCWRQYRNLKLEAALETCSAGWPSTP